MLSQTLLLSLLPLTTIAHFTLDSPTSRPFDDDALGQFPCGGQNTPSSTRTQWLLTGGPIQLTMGHDESAVQVLLGLGNDPGVNFNITLQPIIQEQGLGKFCLSNVVVPDGVAMEGMNATVQVVTNGDPTGGLYNCADITFTSSAPTGAECQNGSHVTTTEYKGEFTNANGTNSADASTSMGAMPSGTGTATAAATPSPTGSAGKVSMGAWTMIVSVAAVGAAALL